MKALMKLTMSLIVMAVMIVPQHMLGTGQDKEKQKSSKKTGQKPVNSKLKQTLPVAKDKPFDKKLFGYAIGLNIGVNLKRYKEYLNIDSLIAGFKDSMAEKKGRMDDKEVRKIIRDFQKMIQTKKREERRLLGEKNKVEGEAFLKKNAKKKKVRTTKTGLQYQILKKGKGPKLTPTDRFKIHYTGTFLDGKEFDSSFKRKRPVVFSFRGVIKAWQEGLKLMKVGSKYRFFVPYKLGYGKSGTPRVPPYSTLIYEIELLSNEGPTTPKAGVKITKKPLQFPLKKK